MQAPLSQLAFESIPASYSWAGWLSALSDCRLKHSYQHRKCPSSAPVNSIQFQPLGIQCNLSYPSPPLLPWTAVMIYGGEQPFQTLIKWGKNCHFLKGHQPKKMTTELLLNTKYLSNSLSYLLDFLQDELRGKTNLPPSQVSSTYQVSWLYKTLLQGPVISSSIPQSCYWSTSLLFSSLSLSSL